ncbi:hypothetical protein [uncultured Marivirga sp.]|uniref:hypothetical protein n=1 Tax=uncultured Marivirga sp. TaxID=1123707 RepID=UPI0030ECFB51|tara:strand:+ start:347417 stop:348022 length:606 start_codon:yes stop_codon:yes gene_type:complete
MEEIINSVWFIISGYLIGIISIIVAVVTYRKSKVIKRPCAFNRTNNLISKSKNTISDIQITAEYKGVPVETLSYTKVAFYNAGKRTIKNSDLTQIDPLRIEIEDEVIYDYEIIYFSKEANNFKLDKVDGHTVLINFDYIDFKQGVIIKIIHSGNTPTYTSKNLKVKGTVIGAKKIETPHPSFPPTNFLLASEIFYEDEILI